MLTISYSSRFRKDYKTVLRRGHDSVLLVEVLSILSAGQVLPRKYRDHALAGNFIGHRECHISSDWLLIYKIDKSDQILFLTRTGSHSDLFG